MDPQQNPTLCYFLSALSLVALAAMSLADAAGRGPSSLRAAQAEEVAEKDPRQQESSPSEPKPASTPGAPAKKVMTCRTVPGPIYPGPDPGKAVWQTDGSSLTLENDALAVTWGLDDGRFVWKSALDKRSGARFPVEPGRAFTVVLADGTALDASAFKPRGKLQLELIDADPAALCRAEREAGWRATRELLSPDGKLAVRWSASLRNGANYVRQEVALTAVDQPVEIEGVTLIDANIAGAEVVGEVDGSPVVASRFFLACEHPTAQNGVSEGRVQCRRLAFDRITKDRSWTASSVVGVAPAGQRRRAFLYYVSRERPRPYFPFLHYNSWYDIAWSDRKMNEAQCLKVIADYGRELVEKRGVRLDSLVFDDGWDDNRTLWRFHEGFPNGFEPLEEAAARFNTNVGVWLSPWGGYSTAKKERLAYGKTQGFEITDRGFSLAGPKYYARFFDACARMVRQYGVNYFKFDGIGAGNGLAGAGRELGPDIDAMLRLITDLRVLRPELYFNVTTGTWPSPYWLWYGDSIWRNGRDCWFHGEGSMRQQWITYRDMITYQMIVRRAPLYPINSLMNQGMCYAQLGTATKMKNDLADIVDEIDMLFAGGTQCQELYVTADMMTPDMWDALARAARWSKQNADVLVDTHWVGGDPGEGQVYGYASWTPRLGILALRNPGLKPQSIKLSPESTFELPEGAPRRFRLRGALQDEGNENAGLWQSGKPRRFDLGPQEVLVFEAVPEE